MIPKHYQSTQPLMSPKWTTFVTKQPILIFPWANGNERQVNFAIFARDVNNSHVKMI